MRLSSKLVSAISVVALFFEVYLFVLTPLAVPAVPETSIAEASTIQEAAPSLPAPQQFVSEILNGDDFPTRLIIPSIRLDTDILEVGVNAKGEMDVPDGKSRDVGWYKYGTIPGNPGSAVIDAHVFAAFKKLRYVKVGEDIFVITKSGKRLHFIAEDSRVYKTSEVPLQKLFKGNSQERLNLITCAGKYVSSMATYDHRLIVYAVLQKESTE